MRRKIFLILVALLLIAFPAYAVKYLLVASGGSTPDPDPEYNTPAYVSGMSGAGDASQTTLALTTFSTTSGNAIIVGAFDYGGVNVSGVADSADNTYVYCGKDSSNQLEIWAAYNITGASDNIITITWASAVVGRRGVAHQVSNIAASSAFDRFASANGTGTAVDSSDTLTTTQTDEYLFAWMIEGAGSTITPGSGWTERLNPTGAPWSGDRVVTTTGAYDFTATLGASDAWWATLATFKASEFVPDETAPEIVSATIPSAGNVINLVFDEAVSIGAGGNAGWTTSLSGGASTMTYSSGDDTTTLVYSLSRTIANGETGTIAYTQPGNGVEDASGNDLVSIGSEAVVNQVPEDDSDDSDLRYLCDDNASSTVVAAVSGKTNTNNGSIVGNGGSGDNTSNLRNTTTPYEGASCFDINGADSYGARRVYAGAIADTVFEDGNFTLQFAVRIPSATINTSMRLWQYPDTATQLMFYMAASDTAMGGYLGGSELSMSGSLDDISNGSWHVIRIVVDRSNAQRVRIYQGANEAALTLKVTSTTGFTTLSLLSTFNIETGDTDSSKNIATYGGAIDDIKIWYTAKVPE